MNIIFSKIFKIKLQESVNKKYSNILVQIVESSTKVITFEMIVQEDPFDIYKDEIDQEKFYKMKADQGLLVNFDSLITKIIELLELCLLNEKSRAPRFLLTFEPDNDTFNKNYCLKIVEVNAFKYLNHFMLNLKLADDLYIRQYLSQNLSKLQREKVELNETCKKIENSISEKLRMSQEAYKQKCDEFHQLKQEIDEMEQKIDTKYNEQLNEERNKLKQVSIECQRQLENQRLTFESQLGEQAASFKNKIERLELENSQLKRKLSHSNAEKTKMMRDYDKRFQELESQHRELKEKLQQSDQYYETQMREKEKICQKVTRKSADYKFIQDSSQKLLEDLAKSHEIIQKIQQESRNFQNKIKTQEQLILSQSSTLRERENELQLLNEKYSEIDRHTNDIHNELDFMKDSYEAIAKEKDELENKLKLNDTVIAWLNKQINELTVGNKENCIPKAFQPAATSISNLLQNKLQLSTKASELPKPKAKLPDVANAKRYLNENLGSSHSSSNPHEITLPSFYFNSGKSKN